MWWVVCAWGVCGGYARARVWWVAGEERGMHGVNVHGVNGVRVRWAGAVGGMGGSMYDCAR